MSTYIGGGPESKLEKAMYWIMAIVFIAFLAYIPFMIMNKQERLEKAWQDQGCQMYDEYTNVNDIPAKCKQDFIDHYAPQEARKQPPEAN